MRLWDAQKREKKRKKEIINATEICRRSMRALEKIIEQLVHIVEGILAILLLLMVLNVSFDVIMRYFFHNSSVAMQELEWHLFAIILLLGISASLKEEAHVRVDFLYERFSERVKAIINIFGTLVFLLPLALLITMGSYTFVHDSWMINEISENPGGLAYRWLIKGMIPLSFTFLMLTALGYILRNIRKFQEDGK
ncbi:MAG: TRAP transporter small permease subunit [Candidatus Electrothrix scaldis]|nr:MAG: TRAP transporter small permease subunit [Candidatus Electrothrix sp. GW3-3]